MRVKKLTLWALCLLIIISMLGCNKPQAKKPLVKPKRPGVSGFYMNTYGPDDSLASLQTHKSYLNEIYPLWYHVRADGSLKEEPNPKAIAVAKQKGIKIIPLINVVPSQDTVLLDPTARENALNNIISVVKQNKYDGVNIDFEFIPTTGHTDFSVDRDKMTSFMKELNFRLRELGKETHMSVLPHVGVSKDIAGVYDYRGLAPYVDKVTIMCYDHNQAGSSPGPLAPFSWVEQNVQTAIKQGFRASQICLGVATYGYDWPAGQAGGFSLPSRDIMNRAQRKGYQIKWSDKYREPFYVYKDNYGNTRVVWFENEATLKTKISLVEKYKLAGICIWRLGFENQQFWNVIQKNWGKRVP